MGKATKTSWKAGQSGNAAGRPKSAMGALRDKLETIAPSVLAAVIKQALDGDLTASKLVLDRTLPVLKPTDKPVNLDLAANTGMATQAARIFSAGTNGTLSTEQVSQLLTALVSVASITEVHDLAGRVKALEELPTAKRKAR